MRDDFPAECSKHCHNLWHLHNGTLNDHPVIRESTTGVIACGYSWCSGGCGFPALVLRAPALDDSTLHRYGMTPGAMALEPETPVALKAYGSMVAYGLIWQTFRGRWTGAMVDATLGDTPLENVLRRHWI